MQYKSPFHIINPEIKPEHIKLERKKILTQFEINDNNAIDVAGKVYEKFEVLNLFDELENEKKFRFHKRIYQFPELMLFLEEGILKGFTSKVSGDWGVDTEEFIEFVSPFFAKQYSEVLFRAFTSDDLKTFKKVKEIPLICSELSYDLCFKKTYSEFSMIIENLREEVKLIKRKKNSSKSNQYNYYIANLAEKINFLPDYFSHQIDDYVALLLEIVVYSYNHKHHDFAARLIVEIRKISCSEELIQIADNYYIQICTQTPEIIAGVESKNWGFKAVLIFMFLCFFILIAIIIYISWENKTPSIYQNVYYLDTLITNSYVNNGDTEYCFHKYVFEPHKLDSIKNAYKSKETELSKILRNTNDKTYRSFGAYFNSPNFFAGKYPGSHKSHLSLINNSKYDATFFLVDKQQVVGDVHVYPFDTTNVKYFQHNYFRNYDYAIWLYIGQRLNRVWQFPVKNKSIGYGYEKQPLKYMGIFNTGQSYKLSHKTFTVDSLVIEKYRKYNIVLHPVDDTLLLKIDSLTVFDTINKSRTTY